MLTPHSGPSSIPDADPDHDPGAGPAVGLGPNPEVPIPALRLTFGTALEMSPGAIAPWNANGGLQMPRGALQGIGPSTRDGSRMQR